MSVTIKLRKGLASEWAANDNIVLASGEPGFEIDTGRLKIGNGSSAWSALNYASVIPTGLLAGSGINIGLGTNGSTATISVSGLNSSYISDFNEAVDDRIGSGLFVAGTGINLNYDDPGNSFTVSVSGLINNPNNNRILTSRDSTTTGIDAESNLTFDGSLLSVSGNLVVNSGTLNSITFNNIGDPTLSARQLAWNNSEGSLALALSNTYDMYLGGELHYRVRNETGAPIIAGTAVYASGVAGGSKRITVVPKAADGSIRETRFMGLVTENINNGVNGFTTHFGYIRNIDTRGDYAANGTTNKIWASGEPVWAEGDLLYVHPTVAGKLTKVEPKHSISVAIILNRHQSEGKLFVRPTSYGHLDDNHDVAVSGATNGQFLQYNSVTDYWVPSSSGNFTSLSVNNTIVSVSGHTHTSSNITDFNSSVSGLLPTIANSGDNRILTSTGTSTGINAESNATFDGTTLAVSGVITVDNLKLDGNTLSSTNSNGNIIIQPSGTGALQRDGSGNARGQYSVDWQTERNNNNQVAAGNYSVIGGGESNGVALTSNHSTIGGGLQNSVSGANSYYSTIGGGRSNTVSGTYSYYSSIGGGKNNTVSGTNSYYSTIGGGRSNTVSGTYSYYSTIGGGRYNSVSGYYSYYSTIGGGRSNSVSGTNSSYSSIGGGYRNSVSGANSYYSSIGGGRSNSVSGENSYYSSIGGGFYNIVSGTNSSYSSIGGGYRNSVSGENSYYSSIGGGSNNTVSGTYSYHSTIGGGGDNTVSGTYSYYSTIGGGRYNSVSGANSYYSTIGGGRYNTVSGTYSYYSSIGGGKNNTVSGTNSYYSTIGGGRYNTVSGTNSQYSTIPGGLRAAATRYGELCHAAGSFAANGDAQHTVLIARRLTTNNTANQVLLLDNSSARLTLPAKTTWTFEIKLSAYNDTDSASAGWIYRGAIKRDGSNNTSLVGSLIEENWKDSAMNSASASVVADDTNEALEIRVTGLTSKNIRWVAVVDISQVSYGVP